MVVYKIKVVKENKYVDCLPTKHSEKWFFSLTENFAEAEVFTEDKLNTMDIDWIEDCYREKYNEEFEGSLQIELITTLTTTQQAEEIWKEEQNTY